jgi:hypothetical protein
MKARRLDRHAASGNGIANAAADKFQQLPLAVQGNLFAMLPLVGIPLLLNATAGPHDMFVRGLMFGSLHGKSPSILFTTASCCCGLFATCMPKSELNAKCTDSGDPWKLGNAPTLIEHQKRSPTLHFYWK